MKVCLISSVDAEEDVDTRVSALRHPSGGSTIRPYYISKNLARFGCEILHICTNPLEIEVGNIKYSLKKYYKNKLWIVRTFRDIFRMYKECKKFSPDVIYAHQTSNARRALPLKFLLEKPLVFDAHGSSALEEHPNKVDMLWEKVITRMANKITVVTDDVKKIFTELYNNPEGKIKVIGNGVDLNLFRPVEKDNRLKENLGIAYHDKVIVFSCSTFPITRSPANISALKYLVFRLVPKIEEHIENIKFVITGGGPKPNPPSPNVIYTGFVHDLPSYINLADVCIAPYPPSAICGTAGAKNKVIEYFACSKPVVSTEEGIRGFDDAVPNRDFLLAKDSDDFVDKLTTVLVDENLSKKLGESAKKISLKYDWKALSEEVLNVLKSSLR